MFVSDCFFETAGVVSTEMHLKMDQSEISVSLKQPIPEGGWWRQVIATNDSFFADSDG